MSVWFVDQQVVESVPIDDRSVLYGDGLFETIAIRNHAPRFWPLHLERLQLGCDRLGIVAPSAELLRTAMDSAIDACGIDTTFATGKIIVSAGPSPRGYARVSGSRPGVRIGLFESRVVADEDYLDGIRVRLCDTRLAIQPQLAGIKSLGRLEQVLARAEWDDVGIQEGLMRDTENRLICGTMSNVFITSKKRVATPAITRCGVSGIMRRHVLTLLDNASIGCDVRDLSSEDLFAADEVFLTNSQFGVLPVRRCAEQRWTMGTLTETIRSLVSDNGVPECYP